MNESEFASWALSLGIDGDTLSVLVTMPTLFTDRELVDRFVSTFDEIRQLNDEDRLGTTAIENGFITISCCPDGDPIAIDLKTNPGSVHYISGGDIDDGSVISKMITPNIRLFVKLLDDEKVPYDFHEAIAWDITKAENAG